MSDSQMNQNYVIDELFPCPILIVDDCCNHLLEDLEIFSRKEVEEYSFKNNILHVDSTHQAFKQLNSYPFADLKEYIKYYSLIMFNAQGYDIKDDTKFSIDMWCNLCKNGSFLFPHTHPGSMLSGVFYVKTCQEDSIIFYNTQKLISNIYKAPRPTRISCSQTTYKCFPGTLLIWNSDLLHGNPRRDSTEEKIAISFNISFK